MIDKTKYEEYQNCINKLTASLLQVTTIINNYEHIDDQNIIRNMKKFIKDLEIYTTYLNNMIKINKDVDSVLESNN